LRRLAGSLPVFFVRGIRHTLPFAMSPYNVGLWSFGLSYIPTAGCVR
jgi:hypothetical protein